MSVPSSRAAPTGALALLLRLRWTLLLRNYTRSTKNQIGLALTALIFGPLSVGAATFLYLFGRESPGDVLLATRAALTVLYVLWIAAPLLGFPLNESYDPTRLFVYPVPLRTILAAGALGSLIEPSTLLALPILIAVVLLFCKSAAAGLIAAVAVALFMLHTLATAQFLLLSLIGLLRSRQFRDATIVLLPLFGIAYYAGQQLLARGMTGREIGAITRLGIWNAARWLPPGWAAQACVDAAHGRYGATLLLVMALVAAVLVPIPLAAAALGGLYNGERGQMPSVPAGHSRKEMRESGSKSRAAAAPRPWLASWLGGDVVALSWKERLYLLREPQYKALAVSGLYIVVVFVFGFGFTFRDQAASAEQFLRQNGGALHIGGTTLYVGDSIRVARTLLIATFLLLSSTQILFNVFGGEGSAITVLLAFPTPRARLLVAKNLAYAPIAIGLGLIGMIAGAVLLHGNLAVAGLDVFWALIATLVVSGIGNMISVRFPMRMVVRGQRWKSGGNVSFGGAAGCAYAYVQLFCYAGAVAMLGPAAILFLLPPVLGKPALFWLTLPLAMAYAGIIYWAATLWAAGMLTRREPEMVAALAAEE